MMQSALYQNEPHHQIICIDVKSFYASCEVLSLGLNPLTTMLVVMSNAENAGGLVLSASPMAKKVLGISNVSRKFEIPKTEHLIVVPPRMNFYIQKNLAIVNLLSRYAAEEDIHVYSIDESFVDLSKSWSLFGDSPRAVAQRIQKEIWQELHLFTSIGLGPNMLLAKVAMDVEAKKKPPFFCEWTYQDIPDKLWPVTLPDFWGIGKRMALRFQKLGLQTIGDLAHTNPNLLKQQFGVIGAQYYMHAWGIDHSRPAQKKTYRPQEKSIGNSQVLPRNYQQQEQIETVLKELAEQVAMRLHKAGKKGAVLHLMMGYAYQGEGKRGGFSHQLKISPTNQAREIAQHVLLLFRRYWNQTAVRNLGLTIGKLSADNTLQLSLFEEPNKSIQYEKLDQVVAAIRNKYHFTAIVRANSLKKGATAIARSTLVGGHAGGMAGLE